MLIMGPITGRKRLGTPTPTVRCFSKTQIFNVYFVHYFRIFFLYFKINQAILLLFLLREEWTHSKVAEKCKYTKEGQQAEPFWNCEAGEAGNAVGDRQLLEVGGQLHLHDAGHAVQDHPAAGVRCPVAALAWDGSGRRARGLGREVARRAAIGARQVTCALRSACGARPAMHPRAGQRRGTVLSPRKPPFQSECLPAPPLCAALASRAPQLAAGPGLGLASSKSTPTLRSAQARLCRLRESTPICAVPGPALQALKAPQLAQCPSPALRAVRAPQPCAMPRPRLHLPCKPGFKRHTKPNYLVTFPPQLWSVLLK